MADINRSILVFYVIHPDEETASRIAGSLTADRLIACANIFPVKSMYEWEGAPVRDSEWVSILKTGIGRENEVENAIVGQHPYTVPCIIRYEARVNAAYADWIEACTRK